MSTRENFARVLLEPIARHFYPFTLLEIVRNTSQCRLRVPRIVVERQRGTH